MSLYNPPIKYNIFLASAFLIIALLPIHLKAQDTANSLLNFNKIKFVKKTKSLVDSLNVKLNEKIYSKGNEAIKNLSTIQEVDERPLPYERLLTTKYNLTRRAYQNTVSQYNYLFYANESLNEIIQNARASNKDEFDELLNFYDYDLGTTSKSNFDSIIYRCNANIVLHDLRSNWVDDPYLLLAKSYLFHRNFDTAASILQFINYTFDEQKDGQDIPIGSNLRNNNGQFSIANKEDNRIWENKNIRNESMLWQARNYIEAGQLNEALSLLQLLQSDVSFPKRLQPFLKEQLAYVYYTMESYENAAIHLTEAIPNAIDNNAKIRWYYLIAQLWQQVDNSDKAYTWYKKAAQFSANPMVEVYAAINMIRITAQKSNKDWELLANNLEKIAKKEKYNPFKDIIYYEIAKLAIQNKSFRKATQWLILSIKNNDEHPKQKQNAFELLGEINYNENNFSLAKIAYDSLNGILKTNPQYEKISLRKKWLETIVSGYNTIHKEDTLQYIYESRMDIKNDFINHWSKRTNEYEKMLTSLFSRNLASTKNRNIQIELVNKISQPTQSSFFYFENSPTIYQGKQSFVQKWGERPNIDNWRRKTSIVMASAPLPQLISQQDTLKNGLITIDKKVDTNTISIISNEVEYKLSKANWNKAALTTAQTFLLQLNDFEKAKKLYQQIIERDIDSVTTERAFLDLASQYIHNGENEIADSILQHVIIKFPNGYYMQKKKVADSKKIKDSHIDNLYKEAYFQSKIGNWDALANIFFHNKKEIMESKWQVAFQFLKVQMYAQQQNDKIALNILDSIILISNNEIIKEKAKNLINEINNRKETEQYLTNLQFEKIAFDRTQLVDTIQSIQAKTIPPLDSKIVGTKAIIKTTNIEPKKSNINSSITSNNKVAPYNPNGFIYDSTEIYYIALATNNTTSFIAHRIKDSLLNNYKIDFIRQKIGSTMIQLQENSFIIWIGPFENAIASHKYLSQLTPTLTKGLNDYIAIEKYLLFTIGKSNITKIKSFAAFKEYNTFIDNLINNP